MGQITTVRKQLINWVMPIKLIPYDNLVIHAELSLQIWIVSIAGYDGERQPKS